MRFKAFISGFVVASIPLSVVAFPMADCDGQPVFSHHWIETGHQIIGPGVVSYQEVGGICDDEAGCTETETLIISACETGRTLMSVTRLRRDLDQTSFDGSDEAAEILVQFASSETSYSWESLKSTLEQSDFRVEEYMESKENCACAAAFPELRNGKEKFEGL